MKKHNFRKVLVIGSGPIIIGQGAEFDYSGTQACKVLKEEGIEVVLVNSNPATIMTDPTVADHVYMEPMTPEFLEKIIEKERPEAMIAGMGGQTALNLSMTLWKRGVLEKYKVAVIGTSLESIHTSEDREAFRTAMEAINQPCIESHIAEDVESAVKQAHMIGLPVIIRPAFTLGGTGGGIATTEAEVREIARRGIEFSIVGQVLVERSIKGWKEIEYEMIRDGSGNVIAVCNMENFDPVGVHTGDSIVVAPSQTLNDLEYQMLRRASIDIVNALDIKGGCNVQLALDPVSDRYFIIEVNPRVSRSSALASKATGYPIAKVATRIALGYDLDEIVNDITGKTKACFEPTLDYVVVKIPKWPFDKFKDAEKVLGTMMMATGEVMAIAGNFEAALLKAVRSLEIGMYNLRFPPAAEMTDEELTHRVINGDDMRLFFITELLRRGVSIDALRTMTGIDPFFLSKLSHLVRLEESIRGKRADVLSSERLKELKLYGFADKGMSQLMVQTPPDKIYNLRRAYDILPAYKMVDTCASEFEATSPYYYSIYGGEDEVEVSNRKKVIVIGSGPIRIGQGVEFDYCSVHGVLALKALGYEAIIVNNNPETVSTDFDLSDKLYFEPITEEDILNIVDKEKPIGIILQYGGQTAIKLAKFISEAGIPILGTSFEAVNNAEDRECFNQILIEEGIPSPKGYGVSGVAQGMEQAKGLRFPLLVRPSYVIGGLGMEIVYETESLKRYLVSAFEREPKSTVLIDEYINGLEVEVDAISDGQDVLIPGIMEHLERAGVHSGDSISIYPAPTVNAKMKARIAVTTRRIARALKIVGLLNIQFIVDKDALYVIEVNPRASRTVPFLSKVTGVPMIELSTRCMLGETLSGMNYLTGLYPERNIFAVKHPVFSMEKIPFADSALGPEMKSTGEVLCMDKNLDHALYKGFVAATGSLRGLTSAKAHYNDTSPESRAKTTERVFLSISDSFKDVSMPMVLKLSLLGYEIVATSGTAKAIRCALPEVRVIDAGTADEALTWLTRDKVSFSIILPTIGKIKVKPGFRMRRRAVENKVMCLTAFDTFNAVVSLLEKGIDDKSVDVFMAYS
jgi:carbamoyl-phosphate synthase large subunit